MNIDNGSLYVKDVCGLSEFYNVADLAYLTQITVYASFVPRFPRLEENARLKSKRLRNYLVVELIGEDGRVQRNMPSRIILLPLKWNSWLAKPQTRKACGASFE